MLFFFYVADGLCPAGYWCDGGSRHVCPDGFYGETQGATTQEEGCLLCPIGQRVEIAHQPLIQQALAAASLKSATSRLDRVLSATIVRWARDQSFPIHAQVTFYCMPCFDADRGHLWTTVRNNVQYNCCDGRWHADAHNVLCLGG